MTFLVTPQAAITPLGNCSCGVNSCNENTGSGNNPCGTKCGANCTTFQVCVTPTGAKMSPQGIGSLA